MFEILANRSTIEISGESPLIFLQKLTTNDLTKNKYCYSFMLNNQGRYLFDFFVYSLNSNTVLIDINTESANEFIAKLNFYKLRTNVTITTNSDYNIVYSKKELSDNILYSYQDPRFSLLGFRSLVFKENYQAISNSYNLYLNDKYEFAIPDGYTDLIVGKSIPVEYGAEELHSIDYNKGCYVGQEVISRTKYQGVLRKKIFKAVAAQNLNLETRAEIRSGETVVGTCCSYYNNNVIALIREENLQDIQNVPITIENIPVELVIPKWRQI